MGCCISKKQNSYNLYLEIIKNKRIQLSGHLYPPPTKKEKELLLILYDDLPKNIQSIILLSVDIGAGTGIDLPIIRGS